MRSFSIVISGFFFLFTAAVSCADDGRKTTPQTGFYASLTSSAVCPFSLDTSSPDLSPGKITSQWGVDIDGALGYRYGDFRIEGELMHGRSNADQVSFAGGGGDLSGSFDMWGAAVNFFYDIPTGGPFRPYVGAGLGALRFEANDITLADFPPTCGSNTLFAYKLMAGVSYALADTWRLLLGYRFMGMGGQDYETGGIPLHGDPIQTHAVQVGVQFYF